MPTQAEFWSRIAPAYARRPIADPDAYEATLTRVAAHLHRDDEVLELGGGTGGTALRLARYVTTYHLTDIAPAMIEIARERVWEASPGNVRLSIGDAASLGDARFDAVLAFNLFHLVDDAQADLARVSEMLRPGGLFISKTPCLAGIGWRGPLIRLAVGAMRAVGKAPEVRFYSIAGWQRMIRAAGFEILEEGNYPAMPPNRFVVAQKV
jgi:ubiquinone/menaquinone biosynthesis C-methylase UbiE